MAERTEGRLLPPLPGLIAGGLVIVGLVLSIFVAYGFLVLAGMGAFGPGILRELGWLRDQDEFQRQAAYRAGYIAYLTGGFTAVLTISALRWGDTNPEGPAEWIILVLLVLWMTWLFSSMLRYWGARKTASRVLIVFGSFWAVFVIAGISSEPVAQLPVALLMGVVFVGPFFGLAWTAGRWPRRTGAGLLAVSAFFLLLTTPTWAARSLEWSSILVTATLLVVPMISCGIALLRYRSSDNEKDDEVG